MEHHGALVNIVSERYLTESQAQVTAVPRTSVYEQTRAYVDHNGFVVFDIIANWVETVPAVPETPLDEEKKTDEERWESVAALKRFADEFKYAPETIYLTSAEAAKLVTKEQKQYFSSLEERLVAEQKQFSSLKETLRRESIESDEITAAPVQLTEPSLHPCPYPDEFKAKRHVCCHIHDPTCLLPFRNPLHPRNVANARPKDCLMCALERGRAWFKEMHPEAAETPDFNE